MFQIVLLYIFQIVIILVQFQVQHNRGLLLLEFLLVVGIKIIVLVGGLYVSNSYNIANIKNSYSANRAAVIAFNIQNKAPVVCTNCYGLTGATGVTTSGVIKKDKAFFQNNYSTISSELKSDYSPNINNGFPILKWQVRK